MAELEGQITSGFLTDEAFDLSHPDVRVLLSRLMSAEERAQAVRAELEVIAADADQGATDPRAVARRLRRLLENTP